MRKTTTGIAVLAGAIAALLLPAGAQGAFGIDELQASFENEDGSLATQAGSHPHAFTTTVRLNYEEAEALPEGRLKDVIVDAIPGLSGDATAYERCTTLEFLETSPAGNPDCPLGSAVGATAAELTEPGGWFGSPVFTLTPPPGAVVRLGFRPAAVSVIVDVRLKHSPPYNVSATVRNAPQALYIFANTLQLWGDPSDPSHDGERGDCFFLLATLAPGEVPELKSESGESCPIASNPKPFLTLPTRCGGENRTEIAISSWGDPGAYLPDDEPDLSDPAWVTASDQSPPFTGCAALGAFKPSIGAEPTSRAAQSPTGLDFALEVEDEGLTSVNGRSQSQIEETVVTLPEGMSVNPSQAEGLEVCSEGDLRRETASSRPGDGCPEASKVGTIETETPLLGDRVLKGSLFVAEPYANLAGDSLIAVYVVIKDPGLGIVVKQPIEVEPDPETGQLVSTAADMPQLPFSSFRLHFREGGRSPLITPPGCGDFEVSAEMTPWSGGPKATSTASFELISGPGGSGCPSGAAPFAPGFEAGTINNAAASHSPFYMRLTRADAMQDLSRFSAVLPPGVAGAIAAIPHCPEAAIALARARTGAHGGSEELAHPSCPAASRVGRTVAGAGVGSQLTYVPGSLYLAGPYGGAPLSVVSITPAVAGPFDAGTVVVREALRLNPITGVVEVDGLGSDPIPHILQGIPLNVRDLRVYVDRPAFTLNATSCEPAATLATIWGSGTVLDPSPETPVGAAARYQAAGCAALGFEPRLALRLRGGTRRGAFPALRAVVTPRPGEANFQRAVVTLPRSAFLEQGHIRTVCTRVQFAAGAGHGSACPPGARYGFARAWSPLLDAPAEGPVFLRSSDNKLPDLAIALTGPPSAPVSLELSARIDSVRGGIRSTFAGIPDLPVSRFILAMQGGRKGLIVNSRNLCAQPRQNRAKANLRGQNGRLSRTRPRVIAAKCAKARQASRGRAGRGR